jgi:hypothetical protein
MCLQGGRAARLPDGSAWLANRAGIHNQAENGGGEEARSGQQGHCMLLFFFVVVVSTETIAVVYKPVGQLAAVLAQCKPKRKGAGAAVHLFSSLI